MAKLEKIPIIEPKNDSVLQLWDKRLCLSVTDKNTNETTAEQQSKITSFIKLDHESLNNCVLKVNSDVEK